MHIIQKIYVSPYVKKVLSYQIFRVNLTKVYVIYILAGVRDFCETETFNASCRQGEVIVMKSALYGRMRLGRCVRKDLGYIGCYQGELLQKIPCSNTIRTLILLFFLHLEYIIIKLGLKCSVDPETGFLGLETNICRIKMTN